MLMFYHRPGGYVSLPRTYNGIEIHVEIDPVCFDVHEMSGICEKTRHQRTVEI